MSRRYPSTYEAPVWRLLKYAVIVWLFGVAVGISITVVGFWTDWWQQISTATVNFHMVNPWFLLIYGGFGSVALLYHRAKRGKTDEEKKRRKYLQEHGLLVEETRK